MELKTSVRGNQINWNQLFYFNKIALCGSMKDAALELGVSPSTLSEHLSQLEKDLEVELFLRQSRKLVLTAEGARLFQHTKKMFESSQRILDMVSPLALGSYPVSVAIAPGPSVQLAKQILGHYVERFGERNIKVSRCNQNELERGLLESRFDFAFSDKSSIRKDLVSKVVARSALRFFVAARLGAEPAKSLFRKLPLILCTSEPGAIGMVEQLLESMDLHPAGQIVSEYPSLAYEFCEAGLGIGVFNEDAVRSLKLQTVALNVSSVTPKTSDELVALWSQAAARSEGVGNLQILLSDVETSRSWTKFSYDSVSGGGRVLTATDKPPRIHE